jgi:hypothetical protein
MQERHTLRPFVIAVATGIALWLICHLLSSAREPWDSSVYWIVVYPAATAVAVFLALRYPHGSWLRAILIFESQLVAQWVVSGEVGNLWPIAMVFFAVVSLPAGALATIAARRSQRARDATRTTQ